MPADRPDNLFEPVEADYAAHGIFDSRAHAFSMASWLNLNRTKAIAGGLLLGCMAALFVKSK